MVWEMVGGTGWVVDDILFLAGLGRGFRARDYGVCGLGVCADSEAKPSFVDGLVSQ